MTDLVQATTPKSVPGLGITALFLGAIILGSLLGLFDPDFGAGLSQGTDATLLIMLGLLFFEIRLKAFAVAASDLRFIALAWGANFLVVPVIGYAIASLFLSGQPLLFTGLLIYFLAPCTDWVLSFTRMARGDTALGAALLPINLVTQLLLFPVWLWLFAHPGNGLDRAAVADIVTQWFLLPFLSAQTLRLSLERLLPEHALQRVYGVAGALIPCVTAALVLQIFAGNIVTIAAHALILGTAGLAILCFFVATYALADMLARQTGLRYEQHALLAMTTAARNAPLMLALTAVALPGQPLIYTTLIVGMLVEFPHLIALKQLLLAKAARGERAAGHQHDARTP
ncbi:MAG: arsenic resistance protein [Pseudomonadota bacterium]